MIAEKSRQQMDLVANIQTSTVNIKEGASQSASVSVGGEKLGKSLSQNALDLSDLIAKFKV